MSEYNVATPIKYGTCSAVYGIVEINYTTLTTEYSTINSTNHSANYSTTYTTMTVSSYPLKTVVRTTNSENNTESGCPTVV